MESSTTARYLKVLVGTAFFAGSLDLLTAMTKFVLKTGRNPLQVPAFIASGVFGQAAFSGSAAMVVWGVLLHYIIAFLFTGFFLWLAYRWAVLVRHRVMSGILYGLLMWGIMNLMVIPASQAPKLPFNPRNAGLETLILILCMGMPISFLAARYVHYRTGDARQVLTKARA